MIVTVSTFRTLFLGFLTGISQEDYRAAVRAGADIFWFCPSCSRPDADPVAESTRISESETEILESEEFNPPLPSSDSDLFESTVYEPPAQPALDESTLDDPTPNPAEAETEPLTFQFLEGGSERGKRKLIDNGDTVITWRLGLWIGDRTHPWRLFSRRYQGKQTG